MHRRPVLIATSAEACDLTCAQAREGYWGHRTVGRERSSTAGALGMVVASFLVAACTSHRPAAAEVTVLADAHEVTTAIGAPPTAATVSSSTVPEADRGGFPVVGERASPADDATIGEIDESGGPAARQTPVVQALIGRVVDGNVTDRMLVTAYPDPTAVSEGGSPWRDVEVGGVAARVVDMQFDNQWVSLGGTPSLTVQGPKALSFLESAGPSAIRAVAAPATAPDQPDFTIQVGSLPSGYSVVVPPEVQPRRYRVAELALAETPGGFSAHVSVGPRHTVNYSPAEDFVPVDVNGHAAWQVRTDVIWEQAPGRFVRVFAQASATEVLALARAIRFVDEQTWTAFYDHPIGALLKELSGREFVADTYVGYPWDPALEGRPMTIAFIDGQISVKGVCTSRFGKVAVVGSSLTPIGPFAEVGVGCGDHNLEVDGWQNALVNASMKLALDGETLTVVANVFGSDVTITLHETTFTGFS